MIAFGIALELGYLAYAHFTQINRASPFLVAGFWLLFGVYLSGVVWVFLKANPYRKNLKRDLLILLAFSSIFHLTLVASPQPLSDDIYRYAWDGKVLLNGLNPYSHAPQSEALLPLRDTGWVSIQNKSIHTMYPPLAQLFFALSQAVSPGLVSLRLLAILAHIGASLVCFSLLKKANLDPRKAIVFAWSPLCIIEFSNSAHIDSLAIFFLLCAIYLAYPGKLANRTSEGPLGSCQPRRLIARLPHWEYASPICLAAAVLVKVFPIFCLPFLLPKWTKRGQIMFFVTLTAVSLPFIQAAQGFISGTTYFTFFSTFNSSVFTLLWFGLQKLMSKTDALFLTRLLVYALFLLYWQKQFALKPEREMLNIQGLSSKIIFTYGLIFILSPTLHAWYLTWILPFLCFAPYASWMLLSGLVFLARSVYSPMENRGLWQDVGLARLFEYVPFYIALGVETLLGNPLLQRFTRQPSAGVVSQ